MEMARAEQRMGFCRASIFRERGKNPELRSLPPAGTASTAGIASIAVTASAASTANTAGEKVRKKTAENLSRAIYFLSLQQINRIQ